MHPTLKANTCTKECGHQSLMKFCKPVENQRTQQINMLKDGKVVGDFKKCSNGRFAKTIFYFLRSDTYAKCCQIITGKPVNFAEGEGMQVPCMLELEGQGRYIDV